MRVTACIYDNIEEEYFEVIVRVYVDNVLNHMFIIRNRVLFDKWYEDSITWEYPIHLVKWFNND